MARTTKKAAAKKEEAALVSADLMNDMVAHQGAGTEHLGAEDLAIPFLTILQSGSPQVKRSEPEYIQGAQEGNIYNNVSFELVDGDSGILVIPCGYQKRYVEWVDREAGGGLVGQYDPNEPHIRAALAKHKGAAKIELDNGNILVETNYHFVLQLDEDHNAVGQAVMGMSSTQLKKSRRWNSLMTNQTIDTEQGKLKLPIFGQVYRFTTMPEANNKGAWMGWALEYIGPINVVETYRAAKSFYELVGTGAVNVAPPQDVSETSTDEDLPF